MITAAVYWVMKFQFDEKWSRWVLALPMLLDWSLIVMVGRVA